MTDLSPIPGATPLLPEVRKYLDIVRASGARPSEQQPSVDAARRASDERRQRLMAAPTPMATVRDLTVSTANGDVPVRCYSPATDRLPGCLVWFHGGGWVLGDLDGTDAEPPGSPSRPAGWSCPSAIGWRRSTRSQRAWTTA